MLMAALAGCTTPGGAVSGDSFVAYWDDFAPFRTWTSVHDDLEDAQYDASVNGPRTQYIRALPPAGATEFPIGTMIVEARESGTMPIFAMVKRGDGFNPSGARDWEWFELEETPDRKIKWRGYGPRDATDSYGGDPATCNNCHSACGATNDYVCSPKLRLTPPSS